MREGVAHANIWDEANGHLRHGAERSRCHDSMRAMGRDAKAAPHDNTFQQSHKWLVELTQPQVQAILLFEEVISCCVVAASVFLPDPPNIAAGAEGSILTRRNDDLLDGIVVLPLIEGIIDAAEHLKIQGVESLWAIEFDHPRGATNERSDVGLGIFLCCRHSSMVTRITLWCANIVKFCCSKAGSLLLVLVALVLVILLGALAGLVFFLRLLILRRVIVAGFLGLLNRLLL